ncbi:MAG: aerotaxis receptor Aer [Sulfuricurvum sp. PC08-66]|nr:MAG: aerotaxis receptor Aer [Sulfuricurvum sp. PC08-66]
MQRPAPIDEEFLFEGRTIISETDTKGIITYANRTFCDISGYSKEELVGSPHNIIRHPDMPKAAFKEMWDAIQMGKSWHGFVKNMRKDGRYYWVESYVSPIYDDNQNIAGYIAARTVPKRKDIEHAITLYASMRANEQ